MQTGCGMGWTASTLARGREVLHALGCRTIEGHPLSTEALLDVASADERADEALHVFARRNRSSLEERGERQRTATVAAELGENFLLIVRHAISLAPRSVEASRKVPTPRLAVSQPRPAIGTESAMRKTRQARPYLEGGRRDGCAGSIPRRIPCPGGGRKPRPSITSPSRSTPLPCQGESIAGSLHVTRV